MLVGLALLTGFALSVITAEVLVTAGLLCVALHLPGADNTVQVRSYRRRR